MTKYIYFLLTLNVALQQVVGEGLHISNVCPRKETPTTNLLMTVVKK